MRRVFAKRDYELAILRHAEAACLSRDNPKDRDESAAPVVTGGGMHNPFRPEADITRVGLESDLRLRDPRPASGGHSVDHQ